MDQTHHFDSGCLGNESAHSLVRWPSHYPSEQCPGMSGGLFWKQPCLGGARRESGGHWPSHLLSLQPELGWSRKEEKEPEVSVPYIPILQMNKHSFRAPSSHWETSRGARSTGLSSRSQPGALRLPSSWRESLRGLRGHGVHPSGLEASLSSPVREEYSHPLSYISLH